MHVFISFVYFHVGKHSLDVLDVIYREKEKKKSDQVLFHQPTNRYFCSKIFLTNMEDRIVLSFVGFLFSISLV